MIDAEQARQIASAAVIANLHGPQVVLGPHTGDVDNWWVFSFNTPEFWETGDFAFAVIGAGPIAVSKVDGHIERLKNTQDPMSDLATRPVLVADA